MSKVCVVDDDPGVLQLLGRSLRDGGYDVDLVGSSAKIVKIALGRRYDLILLDDGRPDSGGVTILQALRAQDPHAQVMMVSPHGDSTTGVRYLDFGACDYVGKPFDIPEILARVRARLRPRPRDGSHLEWGVVRLDLVEHCLQLPDRRVLLSAREFLLLRHLMSRAGLVCTRDELMHTVWGYDFVADSNVVDVYVSRLRAKIPSEMIQTVRQAGYYIAAR
jgi:two-component system, OmpR family, response regulator